VEADGVRRAAAGDEQVAVDAHHGKLAFEPEHERLDAAVVHEQVRAEPDRLDRRAFLASPRERHVQLVER
jgi:hypothetical protein